MAEVVFSGALEREKREALSAFAQGVLTGAAARAGIERITVTSTIRTPEAQAEAMYNNIASGRYIRYKKAGQQVTDLCVRLLGKQASRNETIAQMTALIEDLSENGERVSKHCVSREEYAKRNIVDISKSLVYDKAIRFIKDLASMECVTTIIQSITSRIDLDKVSFDDAEPAIHIEIDIPEKYRV